MNVLIKVSVLNTEEIRYENNINTNDIKKTLDEEIELIFAKYMHRAKNWYDNDIFVEIKFENISISLQRIYSFSSDMLEINIDDEKGNLFQEFLENNMVSKQWKISSIKDIFTQIIKNP